MLLALSTYVTVLLGILVFSAAVTSLTAALWMLGIFHGICVLGILALWWVEVGQRDWREQNQETDIPPHAVKR
jgi:hypothetical protein